MRQALSMAIDRSAYIATIYHGYGQLPRALENPGAWGYGKSVFQADWNRLPVPTVDLAKARALVKAAGAEGKSITIGTTGQIQSLATAANLVRQAATEIGLKVTIDSVSAANFINFFTNAGARKGVDMFPTSNYPDYADPAGLYNTFAMPGRHPELRQLLRPGRSPSPWRAPGPPPIPTCAPRCVAKAGDLIMQQLPWIPLGGARLAAVITQRTLTGAAGLLRLHGRAVGQHDGRPFVTAIALRRRADRSGNAHGCCASSPAAW